MTEMEFSLNSYKCSQAAIFSYDEKNNIVLSGNSNINYLK